MERREMMGIIKDALVIFKREMLIFKANLRTNVIRSITFPLIMLLFFGSLGNSISSIPVAIANYANNPQSTQFINALQSGGTVSVYAVTNQENGLSLLHSGSIVALVVIEPTFPQASGGNPSVQVYYASSRFSELGILSVIQSAAAKFGSGVSGVQQQQGSNIATLNPTFGTSSSYRNFLAASVILMAVAFGAIFQGGISIITDRQIGNLKAFLITPISKNAIIMGKLFSGTLQSMIYGMLALGIGFLFGANIAMGILGLVWIIVIVFFVAMAFNGIALVLGSRIKTIEVYTILSQTIVMPSWFLSGAFFPTSSFPDFLQPISAGDPLTYATSGIRSVMLNGFFPIGDIIIDFTVLIVFTVVAVAISFKLFKSTIS